MADRTQELTLLLRAKNLAGQSIDAVRSSLDQVADKAASAGRALGGMGNALANGLGNATETLLSGGGLGQAAAGLGIYMGGQLVENFGGSLIEKIGSSSLVAAITAPLAAVGSTIGGIIAAAIPVGMALLPFILIGAIVAAVAVLIFNEEIRNKVFAFVGEVIANIGKFLAGLGATLLGLVGQAIDFVATNIGPFVGGLVKAIIDGLWSLPGKIADVIRNAFRSIDIQVGPFHISGTSGVTIDLPKIDTSTTGGAVGMGAQFGHAAGGWVGLHGPEIGLYGEKGPEYVVSNDKLGALGGGPVHLHIHIAGHELGSILLPSISEALYYELQASAPTGLRA